MKRLISALLIAAMLCVFPAYASEIIIQRPTTRRVESNIATTLDYLPEKARLRADELVIGVPDLLGEINPFFARTTGDQYAASLLFDELVFCNADGDYGPGVASYAFAEDTATFTFTVGGAVSYADGAKLTSDDYINALYLLTMPGFDGMYDVSGAGIYGVAAYLAGESESIEGIRRIDEHSFSVRVEVSNAETITYFAIPALRVSTFGDMKRPDGMAIGKESDAFYAERLMKAHSADAAEMAYGQYALSALDAGSEAVLTKHAGYFRGNPTIGTVRLLVVPVGRELDAIMDGDVDIISVLASVDLVDRVFDPKQGFINLFTWQGDVIGYLGMNLSKEPFSDVNVRRALAIGFDREGAKQARIERYGSVPTALMFETFHDIPEVERYAYDPDRAAELLTAAGWLLSEDGIRVKGDAKFECVCSYAEGNPVMETIFPLMQADYKKLGIQLTARILPLAELAEEIDVGACELYSIARRLPMAPQVAADYFVGDSHLNTVGYTEGPAVRDLERARADKDPARQSVLYENLFMELYDELPFIPLYRRSEMLLVNARVMNVTVTVAHEITSDVYRFFLVDTLEGQK